MFELILLLSLLIIGYIFGSWLERSHYQSILAREESLRDIAIFETKITPQDPTVSGGQLVSGNVVISTDYFKMFVAGLRMLVGGRLKTYESLLDRGRREAVLRMKEQTKQLGASQIFNVRFETASISKGAQNSLGSIEVLVYGSAIKNA